MAESIEKLRIYQSAVDLEDQIYQLTKELPQAQYYPLGNDIRRSSAAVAHHIHQVHQRYAYGVKLSELDLVREAAELTQKLIRQLPKAKSQDDLIAGYTAIIKQSWGLTKYLRQRQAEQRAASITRAADELVAARSL